MRLRLRDIPFLMLEAVCWIWVFACFVGFVGNGCLALLLGDRDLLRVLWIAPVATVPGLFGLWLIGKYFAQRRGEERDTPGFDVLPPR